jgi:hypothetical protein
LVGSGVLLPMMIGTISLSPAGTHSSSSSSSSSREAAAFLLQQQ